MQVQMNTKKNLKKYQRDYIKTISQNYHNIKVAMPNEKSTLIIMGYMAIGYKLL